MSIHKESLLCLICLILLLNLVTAFHTVHFRMDHVKELNENSLSHLSLSRVATTSSTQVSAVTETTDDVVGNVALLIPSSGMASNTPSLFGSKSPVGCTNVADAARHLCRKIEWYSNGLLEAKVFTADDDIGEKNFNVGITSLLKKLTSIFMFAIKILLKSKITMLLLR